MWEVVFLVFSPSRLIVRCGICSRCSMCGSISGLWAVLYDSCLFLVVLTVRGRHRCQAQLFCHHEKLCHTTLHWGLDDPWVFTAGLHWCDFNIFNICILNFFIHVHHLDYLSYCHHLLVPNLYDLCFHGKLKDIFWRMFPLLFSIQWSHSIQEQSSPKKYRKSTQYNLSCVNILQNFSFYVPLKKERV